MNATPSTYRNYLRSILVERKKQNPQFSLRGFARILGVQPTFLSYILNGKRDLSDEMIEQFIERLKLTSKDAKIFELLVKLEKTKNVALKSKILESLKQIDPSRSQQRNLAVDHFTLISEWYHYALFMLIDIEGVDWNIQSVARIIGINVFEVQQALERLQALDLIHYEENARPRKLETRIMAKSPIPNGALKKHQNQLLDMTKKSLDQHTTQERFTGSEMIVLSQDQLSEAEEIFEECFNKIISLSHKKTKSKNVYQVGIQLFPMTQIKHKKES